MAAKKAIPNTDHLGTRLAATRRQSGWPGTARSREKANIIRDAEVMDAVTQKNCAITQMKRRNSAQFWLIDSAQENGTMYPTSRPRSIPNCVLGSWKVTARSRIQPKTTETTTDMYMPTAAAA